MGRRWERGRLGGREIIQHSLFCPGAGMCNHNSPGVSFYRGAIISRNLSITYFTLPTLTWCQDLLFNCWSCFRVSWFCNINPGSSQLARHDLQSQQTFHFFLSFLSRVKDRLDIIFMFVCFKSRDFYPFLCDIWSTFPIYPTSLYVPLLLLRSEHWCTSFISAFIWSTLSHLGYSVDPCSS